MALFYCVMSTNIGTTSARKHRKNAEDVTNDNDGMVPMVIENEMMNVDYSGDKDKASNRKQQKVPIMNTILSAGRRITRSSSSYDRHTTSAVSPLQQDTSDIIPVENTLSSSIVTPNTPNRSRGESLNDSLNNSSTNHQDFIDDKIQVDTTGNIFTEVLNNLTNKLKYLDGKKMVSILMLSLITLLILDTTFSSPENRIFKPDFSEKFLFWVQMHPGKGLFWILLFMAIAVVFMVPIGTPITVGCGYIYKGAYGWKIGIIVATLISMAGSALGAVTCFLLGRYLMRDQVRKWIKKYPLFDAIDAGKP